MVSVENDKDVLAAQKNEITEHFIYAKLAKLIKHKKNSDILEKISRDELKHYGYWKSISKADVKPDKLKILFYTWLSYALGLSFGLRLMENGEKLAQKAYSDFKVNPKLGREMMLDEQRHEKELLGMFEEEKLDYASSIVLGLNDALVELTGALAGFSFALQNGKLIGIIGLITGIAAAMSMAASGYLSSKEDGDEKAPIKSAIYTGTAYLITVALLITPFFIIDNVFISLAVTLLTAISIIFSYTFYIAVAKGYDFWKRFIEMAAISLTVAVISFGMGWVIKTFFGVDV